MHERRSMPQAPTELSRVLPLKVTHRNISIPKLSNIIEQQLGRNHTLRSVRVKMPNLVRLYRPFCATRLAFRRGGSRAARQKLTTLRAEHSARAGRVPRVQEHLRSQVRPNLRAAATARYVFPRLGRAQPEWYQLEADQRMQIPLPTACRRIHR